MKNAGAFVSMVLAIGLLAAQPAIAQEKAYKEGSVWSIALIKVKPGMFDQYMRDLSATRKPILEEGKKQGLILSHRMLSGNSANRDDFNMILLVEYKDWAAFDGLSAKFEAIGNRVIGGEEKQVQLMVKRADMREIFGGKNMQEYHFK